jgi:Transglutaminase-like superfamily
MERVLANGNVPVSFQTLPGGFQGTDDTVAQMQQLATGPWGSRSPKIHALALNILNAAQVEEKDYIGEMVAIHNYVRDTIRYTRDVSGQETLYPPEEVAFNSQAGDCDDKCMLEAALLGSIGITSRFITIGVTPDRMSHVYLQAKPKDTWISLDPIMRNKPAGWEVPASAVQVSKVYPENFPTELQMSMNGLGDSAADASANGGTPGGQHNSSPFSWFVGYQGGGFTTSHLTPDMQPPSSGSAPYIVTDSMSDTDAPIEQISINAPAFPQDSYRIGPPPMRNIGPVVPQVGAPQLAQAQTPVDPNAGQALAQILQQPVDAYDAWNRPHVLMPDGSVSQPHWFTVADQMPIVQCADGSIVKPGILPPDVVPTTQLPDGSLVKPQFTAGPNPWGGNVTIVPNQGLPTTVPGFEADPNAQTYDAWGRPVVAGVTTQPIYDAYGNLLPPTQVITRGPASTNPILAAQVAANPFPYGSVTSGPPGGTTQGGTNLSLQAQNVATVRARSMQSPWQVQQQVMNEDNAESIDSAMNPGGNGSNVLMPGDVQGLADATGIDRQLPYANLQRPALTQTPEGIDSMFTRPNLVLRTDRGDTIVYKGLYALSERPPIRPYNPNLSPSQQGATQPFNRQGMVRKAQNLSGMGMMPARSISGPGVADLADAAAASPPGIPTGVTSVTMAPPAKSMMPMLALGALGVGALLLMMRKK